MVNAHQRNALVLLFAAGMFSACTGGGSSPTAAHTPSVDAWTVPAAGPEQRGVGRSEVVAYLAATQRHLHDIQRFDAAPTVHVVGQASDAQRRLLVDALAIVNEGMPGAMRVRLGDHPYAAGTSEYGIRPGHIGVEFIPPGDLCDYSCTAYAITEAYSDSGRIWYSPHSRNAALMAHEILHILAVQPHSDDPNSVMHGSVLPYARLNTLERDGLLALFSDRLSEGDTPYDLGPWDTDAFVHRVTYQGMFELDVEARNDMILATVRTDAHRGSPADIGTSGDVTWTGRAFGVYMDDQPLKGDVSLSLDLRTLDGDLALVGFGGAYRDLAYDIAWQLDGFIRTGGDAGSVDGHIYEFDGARVAGTVHRTDAAFAWAGGR